MPLVHNTDEESVDGIHMKSGNILDEEHGNLGGMEDSSGEDGDEIYGDDDSESELELAPELQVIKGYRDYLLVTRRDCLLGHLGTALGIYNVISPPFIRTFTIRESLHSDNLI
jgi:hypothetical protein